MLIDAHQHFWALDRGDYGWLKPELGTIYRDFGPSDLAPELRRHGIEGTVLVQAAPTLTETRYLLELARHTAFVLGVVGWVDMTARDAPATIAALASDPLTVALRPMIQDIADPNWMLDEGLSSAFEAMVEHDLVFDALVLPRHLDNLYRLSQRHPRLRTVIDHGAKPSIEHGEPAAFDRWATAMARLAGNDAMHCKLSGLVTEAGADWTVDRLRPYVGHLLEQFGPSRLIWGSDWPVAQLAATYSQWWTATGDLLSTLTEGERALILGRNAERFYRLNRPVTRPPHTV
ncbi:MAG: amidohydrolase family protein [Gammaproteobacteria bacterium]